MENQRFDDNERLCCERIITTDVTNLKTKRKTVLMKMKDRSSVKIISTDRKKEV